MPNPTRVHCPTVQNTPTRPHKGAIQNIIHAQHVTAYSDYVTNPAESGGFQAFVFNKVKEGPKELSADRSSMIDFNDRSL